jgi:1-aminocyclopropane-1-carboxylate deaminase/D-cysteine desulfhydrase-like pyridoxal-dependent ACC family enzyme
LNPLVRVGGITYTNPLGDNNMAEIQSLGTLKGQAIGLNVSISSASVSSNTPDVLGIVGTSPEGSLKVVRNAEELALRNGEFLLKGDSVFSSATGTSTIYLGKSGTSKLTAVQMPANSSATIDDTAEGEQSEEAAALIAESNEVELAEVLAASETEQTQGIFGAALSFSSALSVGIASTVAAAAIIDPAR